LAGFSRAASVAIAMPTHASMRAAWEPTTRAIQKVLRGDATPREALDEAKRRFDDVTRPLPAPADPGPFLVVVGLAGLLVAMRAVRRARDPELHVAIAASVPAYRYVAHAVVVVVLLVVVPLFMGAATSLFATRGHEARFVGAANYVEILTARGGPLLASGSFYAVLLVTILWTVTNVALHLAIGVGLALLLSRPALAMRGAYRVLLVVPWAVPSYVSALAWKGMFHRQLGAVNAILALLHVSPIAWFSRFSTAFAANVATNVWLGFPFMMVVTLGALAGISREVLEAAEIDGATKWQRFWRVTFPLLRPTLGPAVLLGAVWTFNMFNVVFLVSGGEPDGRTEILVSEAYRWAFTRQAQYGYAAAYAVLIFLLLSIGTRLLGGARPETAR
jgi:arabinogalactan oligomer/maltooligosaccharide transport system permease protein